MGALLLVFLTIFPTWIGYSFLVPDRKLGTLAELSIACDKKKGYFIVPTRHKEGDLYKRICNEVNLVQLRDAELIPLGPELEYGMMRGEVSDPMWEEDVEDSGKGGLF